MTEQELNRLGSTLWSIADQLRGAMNADDFRDYMLSFLFLRYLSDNYETASRKELGSDYPALADGDFLVPTLPRGNAYRTQTMDRSRYKITHPGLPHFITLTVFLVPTLPRGNAYRTQTMGRSRYKITHPGLPHFITLTVFLVPTREHGNEHSEVCVPTREHGNEDTP